MSRMQGGSAWAATVRPRQVEQTLTWAAVLVAVAFVVALLVRLAEFAGERAGAVFGG